MLCAFNLDHHIFLSLVQLTKNYQSVNAVVTFLTFKYGTKKANKLQIFFSSFHEKGYKNAVSP